MSRGHVFKLLHGGFKQRPHLRDELLLAQSTAELSAVCDRLRDEGWHQPHFHRDDYDSTLSWYWRHRHAAQPHQPDLATESVLETGPAAARAAAARKARAQAAPTPGGRSAVDVQDAQ